VEIPSNEEVLKACIHEMNQRIAFLNKIVLDLKEGVQNDSKSSAGDKHETSISMMQLEQEKVGNQIATAENMLMQLLKIEITHDVNKISSGNLVKTNQGFFYIAVAIGKLKVKELDLFVISSESPLAKKLIGLKINNKVEINSKFFVIENIF
jgi:hypothetical protein